MTFERICLFHITVNPTRIRFAITSKPPLKKGMMPTMSNQNFIKFDTGAATKKVKEAVGELKQLDDILNEISHVSGLTGAQLKELGDSAFDAADKYGKSADKYLESVRKMYQAGQRNAAQMAELSLLAQTAGGLDASAADSYLIAGNAAYDLKGNVEELSQILDGQNNIAQNASVTMLDMAQAVTQAASAASRSGVKMSELSSLIALAAANTNESGTEIGQTLRELFSTLQDTDNQAVTDAFNALHISMTEIVNGSESLKMPVQLLKELADALDGLPADDAFRSDVLSGIGGTENADTLSAMLDNWSSFEDMLRLYDSGMGSAAQTAEQYAANWEGSLNRLSNTWQDTIHNILSSDVMTAITNQLNGFLSVINKITDKLGSLSSIGVGAGLFAGLKNVGRDKMDSPTLLF